jgi:hypothetical protein
MNDYLFWKTQPRILIEAERVRKNAQSLGLGEVPEKTSSRRSCGFCCCCYKSGSTFRTCLSSQPPS